MIRLGTINRVLRCFGRVVVRYTTCLLLGHRWNKTAERASSYPFQPHVEYAPTDAECLRCGRVKDPELERALHVGGTTTCQPS